MQEVRPGQPSPRQRTEGDRSYGTRRTARPPRAAVARRARVAYEVVRLAACAKDRETLLDSVTRLLARGLYPESVGFLLADPVGGSWTVHPSYHCPAVKLPAASASVPSAKAGVLPEAASRLRLAIHVRSRLAGWLCVESARSRRFGPADRYLAGVVAQAVALAWERLEYEKSARRLRRELAACTTLGRTLMRSLELEELLRSLHRAVLRLVRGDGLMVALLDEEEDRLLVPLAVTGEGRLPPFSYSAGEAELTAWMVREGKPVLVGDLLEQAPTLPARPRFPGDAARSWMGVPLRARRRRLGGLAVYALRPHAFGQADLELLVKLADPVALAIDNARRYQRQEAGRRLAATLLETFRVVGSSLRLEEVLRRILDQLRRVVPYTSASVQRRRGDELEIIACHGFPHPEEILGLRFSIHGNNPNRHVVQSRRPVRFADVHQFFPAFQEPRHRHIRSWLGVPLLYKDEVVGMITLDRDQVDAFTRQDEAIAMAFASQVAVALENAALYEEAERRALTDGLTGLYNNRWFYATLEQELSRGYPVSLIMFDIDDFKQYNDRYGHLAGDDLLRELGELVRREVRISDQVARYGGEEFAVILPRADLEVGRQVAMRLCAAVRAHRFHPPAAPGISANGSQPTAGGLGSSVTISVGLATYPRHGATVKELVQAADMALLAAKREGKDRICVAV